MHTPNQAAVPRLAGLAEIADHFDAAILDQWGVLHDGAKAPPGAVEAVSAMAAAGKNLAILSNSARLGGDSLGRLIALGYDPGWFSAIITSGEMARDMLRERLDPLFAVLGRSVYLIARDDTLIEGTDYRRAAALDRADFLLFGSSTAPEMSLADDYARVLAEAAARGLPAICANPDKVGVAASGLIEGPGTLAAHYESLGGVVRYLGKPHPEVYVRAMARLGGVPAARVAAIGDSLEHDIAGGHRAGCLTVFVEGGIHAADLAKPDGLTGLCERYAARPDFTIPRLVW